MLGCDLPLQNLPTSLGRLLAVGTGKDNHGVVELGRNKMKLRIIAGCLLASLALSPIGMSLFLTPTVAAEKKFETKPVAEKKLKEIPAGPLYWQVENFLTLAEAEAAEGPTSLVAEAAGKVWLFTLGPGASTSGGSKVVEIGPVAPVTASEYLLRVNNSGGPPGAKTPVHTHPGSEAFYVLAGKLSQKTPHGASEVDEGQFHGRARS